MPEQQDMPYEEMMRRLRAAVVECRQRAMLAPNDCDGDIDAAYWSMDAAAIEQAIRILEVMRNGG